MTEIQQFDFSVDLLQFIFWQYDKSNVSALTIQKQDFLNEFNEQFWEDWFTNVFNLLTAENFGISVWSIILGLPLLTDDTPRVKVGWGVSKFRKNFGVTPGTPTNFNVNPSAASLLTEEQRRIVLLLRYRQVTSRGTIADINSILEIFSDEGVAFVRDNLDMSIVYVFDFEVPPWITFIQLEYNILPTPAGVGFTMVAQDVLPTPLDFLVDWTLNVGEGLILGANAIQTSPTNTNTAIVELPTVMDFLVGQVGNVLVQIIAKSVTIGATLQVGYTAVAAANQLSGDIVLTDQYIVYTFIMPLSITATGYRPAVFNPTVASQNDIDITAIYINLIVG